MIRYLFLITCLCSLTGMEAPIATPSPELADTPALADGPPPAWYKTLTESFAVSQAVTDAKDAIPEDQQRRLQLFSAAISERAVVAAAAVRGKIASPEALQVGAQAFPQRNTLYLFWSWEAPGSANLVNVLMALRAARPDIPVAQLHCVRLAKWERMMLDFRKMDQLMKVLIAEQRLDDARRLGEDFTRRYMPLRQMSAYFGTSGMQPFADIRAATALGVENLPSWRYVSQRGLVHGISGCGAMTDLAGWIAKIDHWEEEAERIADKNGLSLIQWADSIAL